MYSKRRKIVKIVGVRFKKVGKLYYFDPANFEINIDDDVLVETSRGVELGKVVLGVRHKNDDELNSPVKQIIRVATEKDLAKKFENERLQGEALKTCAEKVKKHKLEMKLISAEYTFDRSKLLFYFTSDSRVDFRELVRDLAFVFKTRIELRQIGVRDKSKMVGGLGICGRPLCCANHLDDFAPVSINMAKDQNLSLNPVKISGSCGRLMCCLKYEQNVYEELSATLPPADSLVKTPDGNGIVIETQTLRGVCRVKFKDKDGIYTYNADDLKVLKVFKNNRKDKYDRELSKLSRD